MKASRAQIAKIHIAKKQLGIDEGDYRSHLLDFGVEHSNDLSSDQANQLIAMYTNSGFKGNVRTKTDQEKKSIEQYGFGSKKYAELDKRGYPFAASSKLRRIEVLWREVSNSKTDESLQLFIKNRAGVDHITFLYDEHAKIILTALVAMGKAVRGKRQEVRGEK